MVHRIVEINTICISLLSMSGPLLTENMVLRRNIIKKTEVQLIGAISETYKLNTPSGV